MFSINKTNNFIIHIYTNRLFIENYSIILLLWIIYINYYLDLIILDLYKFIVKTNKKRKAKNYVKRINNKLKEKLIRIRKNKKKICKYNKRNYKNNEKTRNNQKKEKTI